MITSIVILGLLCGVIFTLPIGPAGISIVDSYLSKGRAVALKGFLGLLLVEIIYLQISYLVYKAKMVDSFIENKFQLTIVFACVLTFIGISFLLSKGRKDLNLPSGFKGIFSLTIINPSLVLTYIALIALYEDFFGREISANYFILGASSMIIGVGSTLGALSLLAKTKEKFISHHLVRIKKAFGILFITTAICSLGGAL